MNFNFKHQQQGDEAIALGKEEVVCLSETEKEVSLSGTEGGSS